MLGYLSADIICSEQRKVFRERSSRKTVSCEEQVMSKDKYLSIFTPQMEAFVLIILQIFFATRAVLKIEKYIPLTNRFFGPYCKLRTEFFFLRFMAQARKARAINRRETKRRSVTYSTYREDEVSKVFIISLLCA